MRIFAISLLITLFGAPAMAAASNCDVKDLGAVVATLGQQTNQTRAARGQQELRIDRRLNAAAQRHACDLARRQAVSHRSGNGARPMGRIRNAGFRACFSAENVAQGTKSADLTVRAWQSSASHARNQHDPRARAMGFGVARDGNGQLYWVGVYATDCRNVAGVQEQSNARIRPFSW
ncbi:CAP domain-containing protein [Paracoccus sp. M683]|uniref:CAP domain-containing protein n=1 Tax=Paracoccus sp. M683 TaxID=2594268 RepID=UPI00117C6EB5|nr:CAP domain-containing protein [Paracoccus sp. M683]TRW98198.1 CAP domain-containing protein [Paracoccus sp. M683]